MHIKSSTARINRFVCEFRMPRLIIWKMKKNEVLNEQGWGPCIMQFGNDTKKQCISCWFAEATSMLATTAVKQLCIAK